MPLLARTVPDHDPDTTTTTGSRGPGPTKFDELDLHNLKNRKSDYGTNLGTELTRVQNLQWSSALLLTTHVYWWLLIIISISPRNSYLVW